MTKLKELFGDTFILYSVYDEESAYSYEIFQNIFSMSLLRKSMVYKNPSVLFLNEIICFFQKLSSYKENRPICYICDTQSITLYCLRLMEKQGIVSIVGLEDSEYDELGLAYYSLGNTPNKDHWKMYRIKFVKIRSLTMDDVEYIRKIMRFLKVNEEDLYLESQNGLLKCTISPKNRMKVDLFNLSSQLKIYQSCFRHENSDENMLNLKRKWKK